MTDPEPLRRAGEARGPPVRRPPLRGHREGRTGERAACPPSACPAQAPLPPRPRAPRAPRMPLATTLASWTRPAPLPRGRALGLRPDPNPTNHLLLPALWPRRPGRPAAGGRLAGRPLLGRRGNPARGPGGRLRPRRRLSPAPLRLRPGPRRVGRGRAGVRGRPELLAAPASGCRRRCRTSENPAAVEMP